MTQDEFKQNIAAGNVSFQDPPQPTSPTPPGNDLSEYEGLLTSLRRPRRHLTTAPTFTPKSFVDQIQLYDDGTHRRIYFYVNGGWSYTTLT